MGYWFTKRAVSLHIALIVFVPTFLALGWWQLHRALSGNGLSWAYTFEWPLFAIYAVVMWWRIIHDQDEVEGRAPKAPRSARRMAKDKQADADLASYNAYLASLAQRERHNNDQAKGH